MRYHSTEATTQSERGGLQMKLKRMLSTRAWMLRLSSCNSSLKMGVRFRHRIQWPVNRIRWKHPGSVPGLKAYLTLYSTRYCNTLSAYLDLLQSHKWDRDIWTVILPIFWKDSTSYSNIFPNRNVKIDCYFCTRLGSASVIQDIRRTFSYRI